MKATLSTIAGLLVCISFILASTVAAGSELETPPDKSGVFIYYIPGEGSKAFGADVAIDHEVIVHLRKGVVFKTVLEPGSHDFSVLGLSGKRYTFLLPRGKDSYLRLVNKQRAVGIYAVGHATAFELVTKDQGELEISQGQLTPPDPKDLRPKKK